MSKIVLNDIYKSFDKPILQGVSYIFSPAVYGITGASGEGKTTLLNIVLGICSPDSGSVEIDGSVGAVFQEDRLLENLSGIKNVRLVTDCGKEEIAGLLNALGVDGKKPVSKLSGGERRRVCLLRAVINKPTIIVLDEAFKGLDENTRRLTMDFLQPYLHGTVCLNVTHSAEELPLLSARQLHLSNGKLTEKF